MNLKVNEYVFYKRSTTKKNHVYQYMLIPAKVLRLYQNNNVMLELDAEGRKIQKCVSLKSVQKVSVCKKK